ncbi:MAG: YdcF family protein [Deltaproteobacteria bacterium]|nr:YdcF family protein [Deltaproteobacteria bacterium]
MFWIKKIISPFFYPILISIEILLLGMVLLLFTSKKGLAKILIILGIVVLAGLSCDPVSNLILEPLESKYQPIHNAERHADVKWIVVLGGGHTDDPRLPVPLRLSEPSLIRLIEGLRLQRLLPHSKLILTEGGMPGMITGAGIMAEIATALGTAPEDLMVESKSRDTKDQARIIKKIVGNERVIIVTSALHMRRSMALFEKQGMRPIPAPTNYLAIKNTTKRPLQAYLPQAKAVYKVETAFHEYLGLVWAKVRGLI